MSGTPDGTSTNPPAQSDGAGQPAANPPGGQGQPVDWEARYNGSMRVLSQRDAELTALKQQVATLTQGRAEVEARHIELSSKYTVLEGQLAEKGKTLSETDSAYKAAQAKLVKFNALKEFPELLPMADQIPDLPDAAAMKTHLSSLKQSVTDIAQAMAKTLAAGMTPGPTSSVPPVVNTPKTMEEWQKAWDEAEAADMKDGGHRFRDLGDAFRRWAGGQ